MWTFHIARAALYLVALAAGGIGLVMNLYFWHQSMKADWFAQQIWCAACVLSVACKFGAPIAAAVQRKSVFRSGPLTALFLVALTFDVISGLGFSAMTKEAANRENANVNESRDELRRGRDKTEADAKTRENELKAALANVQARDTGRVRAELETAEKLAGGCKRASDMDSRECRTVSKLRAEFADADKRDKLETELSELRTSTAAKLDALNSQLAETKDAAHEDPQVAAIAKIASYLYLTVDASTAATVLGVLIFLLVELGATVPAAHAARMVPPPPVPKPPRPADVPASTSHAPAADAAYSAPMARQKSVPRASSGRGVDLLQVVEKFLTGEAIIPTATLGVDGWIYASQQALADHAGVSKAAVNRQAKVLKDAGRLLVETGPGGTRFKLPGFSVTKTPVSQSLTLN